MKPLPRAAVPILLTIVLVSSSCAGNLMFRKGDRVSIETPSNLATVSPPFALRWSAKSLTEGGHFGIFLDIRPMPPGEDLRYFARARKDAICLWTPGCPDEAYLANIDIFTTTERTFTISGLPDTRPEGRQSTKDKHDITIVLLDEEGRRVDESAYTITVFVDRRGGVTQGTGR